MNIETMNFDELKELLDDSRVTIEALHQLYKNNNIEIYDFNSPEISYNILDAGRYIVYDIDDEQQFFTLIVIEHIQGYLDILTKEIEKMRRWSRVKK